jgi:hypothetical protein
MLRRCLFKPSGCVQVRQARHARRGVRLRARVLLHLPRRVAPPDWLRQGRVRSASRRSRVFLFVAFCGFCSAEALCLRVFDDARFAVLCLCGGAFAAVPLRRCLCGSSGDGVAHEGSGRRRYSGLPQPPHQAVPQVPDPHRGPRLRFGGLPKPVPSQKPAGERTLRHRHLRRDVEGGATPPLICGGASFSFLISFPARGFEMSRALPFYASSF